jgi:hypothetical protein
VDVVVHDHDHPWLVLVLVPDCLGSGSGKEGPTPDKGGRHVAAHESDATAARLASSTTTTTPHQIDRFRHQLPAAYLPTCWHNHASFQKPSFTLLINLFVYSIISVSTNATYVHSVPRSLYFKLSRACVCVCVCVCLSIYAAAVDRAA